MSRSRAPLIIGGAAAAGVGYYLYSSGGKPKVAEKKFESDMHHAAAKVKGELPYSGIGAEAEGKRVGAATGEKLDQAVATAERELAKAKSEAEAKAKEAKAETLKKIDDFDRTVERKTAEAKSGISSWLGFGSK
ncbi:hypothetical protein DL546_006360 [Coniochaeta pulveracea]|uniref:Calcofluor white hypersensitive protein n=1 Tax=Coniochaeta pulveracea TaxID=177199 RepID=A0A420YD02_9PEZI|nr:hypothetical protein DL546_006360 [Coniochaeta pulveracea]